MSASTHRLASIISASVLIAGCGGGEPPTEPARGIDNQAPSASISSPADNSEFTEGASISFEGSAHDPEDGSLSGEALVWESDADGQLGTGTSISIGSLSAASHTVTLTATDSEGATDQASIAINVTADAGEMSASISSPSGESIFSEGDDISLAGSATDSEGRELSESSLEWSSDVDGTIATGQSASVSTLSPGPHTLTLTATGNEGGTASDSVLILVESPGFDIRVQFMDGLSAAEQSTVMAGLTPWENVITGDLEGGFVPPEPADDCLLEKRGVDDLAIVVRVSRIDGPEGTLAQAGPCLARPDASGNFTTSISGIVTIDEADRDNPDLETIIVHEVGHALGIGIEPLNGWGSNVSGLDSRNPTFSGSNAVNAFQNDMDGEAYLSGGVPLANTGSQGTFGGHWRELNFDAELMTGIIDSGVDMPMSRLTVASLADIGYTVDMTAADPFALPMPQVAIWTAEADATLSRPASSARNFGVPTGALVDSILVAGSNNDFLWSSDSEEEIFSGIVRFTLPETVPTGVTVTVNGAWLGLEVAARNAETTGHLVNVAPVTSTWSESSVTWDNRPSFGSAIMAFDFERCNSCLLGNSNLTTLAVDWLNGATANHGLLLDTPDASTDPTFSVGYWSRHASSPNLRPYMHVEASTGSAIRNDQPVKQDGGIPLGDDIARGPVYGIDFDGGPVRVRHIR